MPLYEFYCDTKKCKHKEEVLLSMNEISTYKPNKCPKHKVTLIRQYSPSHLANMSGGSSSSEKELLAKKQQQKKVRSRAHFKNEVMGTIKDPHAQKHFNKKYKNSKKIDHEKMK